MNGRTAQSLSIRTMMEHGAPTAGTDVAAAMFVANLARQAAKEEQDRILYARWVERQTAIQASITRERRVLFAALAVALIVAVIAGVVAVAVLMAYGMTLLTALVVAFLISLGTGCGCTVTVTHVCGH